MTPRTLPSKLIALLVAATLAFAFVACSDDEDEPSPTATSQPQTTATSAPGGPTATPPSTGAGATATPPAANRCPVDSTLCDFAVTLLPILQRGDGDALLRLAEPVQGTCPSAGLGGPSPSLCAGAAPGEKRPGYWDFQGGEGLIVPEADFRRTLDRWFQSIAQATGTDAYGPGALQIASITCSRSAGAAAGICDGRQVRFAFTFINSPQTPVDRGTGLPGQRITFFVEARAIGSTHVSGFGTIVPPNSLLESMRLDARDDAGQPYVLETYPWKP